MLSSFKTKSWSKFFNLNLIFRKTAPSPYNKVSYSSFTQFQLLNYLRPLNSSIYFRLPAKLAPFNKADKQPSTTSLIAGTFSYSRRTVKFTAPSLLANSYTSRVLVTIVVNTRHATFLIASFSCRKMMNNNAAIPPI